MSQDELDAARWREVIKRARFSRVDGIGQDVGEWLIHVTLKGPRNTSILECLDEVILNQAQTMGAVNV